MERPVGLHSNSKSNTIEKQNISKISKLKIAVFNSLFQKHDQKTTLKTPKFTSVNCILLSVHKTVHRTQSFLNFLPQ